MRPSREAIGPAVDGPGAASGGLLPVLLGWVVLPLLLAAAVVLAGVHLGASQPDAWYTTAVRWLSHFFR